MPFEPELVAAKGIVYLMFVGRNIKAYDIVGKLTKARIVSKAAVVYQYVNRLQQKGLIIQVEERPGRGGPTIRTANLDAIFDTIGVSRRMVEGLIFSKNQYSLRHDEKKKLGFLFENMRGLIDFFPEYLRLVLGERKVRGLRWRETLYHFLKFCIAVMNECNIRKRNPEVSVSRYEEIPPVFEAERRIFMIANKVDEAVQTKGISDIEFSILADLTTEGYDDIYKRGTFLNSLYLMALSLISPEAASLLESFMEKQSKE